MGAVLQCVADWPIRHEHGARRVHGNTDRVVELRMRARAILRMRMGSAQRQHRVDIGSAQGQHRVSVVSVRVELRIGSPWVGIASA